MRIRVSQNDLPAGEPYRCVLSIPKGGYGEVEVYDAENYVFSQIAFEVVPAMLPSKPAIRVVASQQKQQYPVALLTLADTGILGVCEGVTSGFWQSNNPGTFVELESVPAAPAPPFDSLILGVFCESPCAVAVALQVISS